MAGLDVYNFQAPQFIEALSEVKLDDGADTFFDAVGSANTVAENPIEASEYCKESNNELPDNGNTSNAGASDGKEPRLLDEGVSNPKAGSLKYQVKKSIIGKSKENDENLDPDRTGPLTRFQRMSMKQNGSLGSKHQPKYLSVAEQIHKFHHSTPPRFKRKSAIFKSKSCKFLPTIAHSPQLRTKIRAARPSTAPTIAPEEKPVIKPIKKKEIIKGVTIKPIPKPPTIPVPFNLTMPGNKKLEQKKEDKTESIKDTVNKGKKTFAVPKTLMRKPLPVKKKRLEIQDNKLTVKESWGVTGIKTIEKPNSTTKTVPFSFEKRNQERQLEKQKKIEEANEQNKIASVASTPRKVPRPSTASVSGSAKQSTKVKNEENGGVGKTPRKSVK